MHDNSTTIRCAVPMVLRSRSDVTDGESWWCSRCKGRKSIREGSFFSKSRLTLQKWLILMYMWAREYPVKDAAEEAEVQEKTAIDVYQWLREVCSTRLITDGPIVLGGPGSTVQIDESLFRHKPKVANIIITVTMLKFLLFFSSIIAEGQQQERCGFSAWWTHLKHLRWDTWRLYPVGMLQPSCPSYKLTLHQTPPFDQISGQHTIGSAQFQQ